MSRLIFGVETEYGFTPLSLNGVMRSRSSYAVRLVDGVRARHPHLVGGQHANAYLGNGARLYVDCGSHPEYATPECTSPEEVVACIRAGDRILEQSARAIESAEPGVEMVLYRSNTDYADPAVTFGCHESHSYRTKPAVVARNIVPHLVTRMVYCGAGGLDASAAGIVFTLSPRARFVTRHQFHAAGSDRALFHGKDESLARSGAHRLHIICGESLCSEWADYLRVGTTALIVALIEAGHEVGIDVHFNDPFDAMHRVAMTVDCRAALALSQRRSLTAIEVQRHYLQRVRENLGSPFLPDWAARLCQRWEETLNRLEANPLSLWRRLDWPLKLTLFRDHARRRGFSWERIEWINREVIPCFASRGLSPVERKAADRSGQLHLSPLWLAQPQTAAAADSLDAPISRDELAAFLALRRELFEIDTRFSQLGPKGIFAALDRSGLLEHQVVERAAIENAVRHAPAGSRARQRARLIRSLARDAEGITCSWTGVVDARRGRVLEMPDPYGQVWPRWRRLQQLGHTGRPDSLPPE